MEQGFNEAFNKDPTDLVTINEKVNLTKDQHETLNIICKVYQMSVSEYMQQALVEAMRFDIEEGNFSDVLLEKIGGEDSKKYYNSPSSVYAESPNAYFPTVSIRSGYRHKDVNRASDII